MNRILKNARYFIFLFTILMGCKKNVINPLQETTVGYSRITVVNAIPGSPGLDVFYGNSKLNGSVILPLARFPNTEYSLLPAANYSLKAVVNTPSVIPSTAPTIAYGATVITTNADIASNKYYSLFLVGPPVLGSASSFLVEDKIPEAVGGKAFIRFINVMPDGNAMDLISGIIPSGSVNPTTTTTIFSNVAKNTAKDFIAIDAESMGSPYQFQLRDNVTGTLVGAAFNLTVAPGRVYTYFARGFNSTYTVPGFSPARTVAAAGGISLIVNK